MPHAWMARESYAIYLAAIGDCAADPDDGTRAQAVTGLFVAGLVGWIVHWRSDPSRGQSSY